MSDVVEINDPQDLEEYRLAWRALLPGTPKASFFHTLDWLATYWRHVGHDQKLRVLIVRSGGTPIGILPLCVRTVRFRLAQVRVLTYPLDDWGVWFGPIGPNPAATMLSAMQHIRRSPRDWDMIELRWVGPDDSEGNRTARAMRVAGLLSEQSPYQTTSIVDLPASWDEFLAGKSHTIRRQLRRTLRHMFEEGSAEFVRHRPASASHGDGDPRWDLYAMCEQVAGASWQSQVTDGNTLVHATVRDFYRDAHESAARVGMLDMNLLLLEGRPAAFLYGYRYEGDVIALRTGFDPAFGDHGIGSALMLRSIVDGIDRGDRTIDFGPGEREHKRRLRTRLETSHRLTYTPLTSWRSQSVHWGRWVKRRWQRPQQPTGRVSA